MSLLRNYLPAVQVCYLYCAVLVLKELSAGTGIIFLAAIFRAGGFLSCDQRSLMDVHDLFFRHISADGAVLVRLLRSSIHIPGVGFSCIFRAALRADMVMLLRVRVFFQIIV